MQVAYFWGTKLARGVNLCLISGLFFHPTLFHWPVIFNLHLLFRWWWCLQCVCYVSVEVPILQWHTCRDLNFRTWFGALARTGCWQVCVAMLIGNGVCVCVCVCDGARYGWPITVQCRRGQPSPLSLLMLSPQRPDRNLLPLGVITTALCNTHTHTHIYQIHNSTHTHRHTNTSLRPPSCLAKP